MQGGIGEGGQEDVVVCVVLIGVMHLSPSLIYD
jgi:hypothetical protein